MSNAIIQTNKLSKVYNGRKQATVALDALNLTVNQGEIFGYLGPNGAGKTTTIRLLLDLIRPTQGSATIMNMDVREHATTLHSKIGFLPGELNLWKGRTALQTVKYLASVRGDESAQIKEAHTIADRLKLDMSKKVGDFSTGNKRKLGLVLAMMHRPDVLILDEPTSGLDPLVQQTFNQMMKEVREEGRTVFLSSHVLSEVQAICDRVGILRDGKLRAVEHVEKLTHFEFRWVEVSFNGASPDAVASRIQPIEGVTDFSANGSKVKFKLAGDFDPVIKAMNDAYIRDIRVNEPTLEEIFLRFYDGSEEVTLR